MMHPIERRIPVILFWTTPSSGRAASNLLRPGYGWERSRTSSCGVGGVWRTSAPVFVWVEAVTRTPPGATCLRLGPGHLRGQVLQIKVSVCQYWYRYTLKPCPKFKVSPDETKFDMSKIHKSNWTVPYTVLVGKIDLHYQALVFQLQKYPNTFLLVFFVSSQTVQNAVPYVENTFKYINTYAYAFCWSV